MNSIFPLAATNSFWVVASVIFFIASVLCSCWWYAKRSHVSYKTALLVLWREGVVTGFKGASVSFIATVKAVLSYAERLMVALYEYLKPAPLKHEFTPDLRYAVYSAIKEYAYTPFQPVIEVRYTPLPSAVYVGFYTKSAITTETTAEVLWHVQAAFQEYLTCYGLDVDYTAVPYVNDNKIELWLYYAETPCEYPAYREACRQAMLMKADPLFQPLPESVVPPTAELVLGYRYEPWRSSGQVVPIVWDLETAPHLMLTGPTGGGKTIFIKALLQRLLLAGADVTICDFKGYGDLRGFVSDYAAGKDCDAALSAFCADFERTRETGTTHMRKVLIFDEFGSFSASKPKKEADELMRMMANLVFMSRAYGYHVILVAQRFDADVLRTNLRDQFGTKIYMGTSISQQAATMLFPNTEIDKSTRLDPYCGYISTPKTDKDILLMPRMDIPALDRRLRQLGKKSEA